MKASLGRAFRRHLIAGLIVIAPLTITAAVLWWLFQTTDSLLGRFLYPVIGRSVHGLGMIALLVLLVTVGWLAERTIGGRIIGAWNGLLERIPIARRIYGAVDNIIRTVFSPEARPFKEVVLVPYPTEGRWSLGFLAARAPEAVQEAGAEEFVTVFIPKAPNPATGFLVIVPRSMVKVVDMSVDQFFTFLLSAGSVAPAPAQDEAAVDEPTKA